MLVLYSIGATVLRGFNDVSRLITETIGESRKALPLGLWEAVRALAKAAGVQNVRIHDQRHAGATILMTLGVPDPIVRKVTGHAHARLSATSTRHRSCAR